MILGAAYNVFDNEELLEASVRSIRSEVDFVAIVYQRTSNFGAPCSASLDAIRRRKAVSPIRIISPSRSTSGLV